MTNERAPYRVLLVDDHQIVRRGLRTVLEERDKLVIVGEAGNVQEAVREAARLRPDVIVMDLRLPDGSAIADGLTNRGIADLLSLTEKTVKHYVSQIYSKLHVGRRPQAARLATERRLRKE